MPVGCYRYHIYVHAKCGIDGIVLCMSSLLVYIQAGPDIQSSPHDVYRMLGLCTPKTRPDQIDLRV
jgi:hypothetical protein